MLFKFLKALEKEKKHACSENWTTALSIWSHRTKLLSYQELLTYQFTVANDNFAHSFSALAKLKGYSKQVF